MKQDSSRQIEGAKHLSALLKVQTILDDAPVELVELDAAQEERRALLRSAWSAAVHDETLDLHSSVLAGGGTAGKDAEQSEGRQGDARPLTYHEHAHSGLMV